MLFAGHLCAGRRLRVFGTNPLRNRIIPVVIFLSESVDRAQGPAYNPASAARGQPRRRGYWTKCKIERRDAWAAVLVLDWVGAVGDWVLFWWGWFGDRLSFVGARFGCRIRDASWREPCGSWCWGVVWLGSIGFGWVVFWRWGLQGVFVKRVLRSDPVIGLRRDGRRDVPGGAL